MNFSTFCTDCVVSIQKIKDEVYMGKVTVELVKYDMDKTKKRKRTNFIVDSHSEAAIIDRLERIHKGEKVISLNEIIWGAVHEDSTVNIERVTGVVKFFDAVKGFGFIQPDVDMDDLFFHASALGSNQVDDDDVVEFQVSEGPKGLIAIKITLIN